MVVIILDHMYLICKILQSFRKLLLQKLFYLGITRLSYCLFVCQMLQSVCYLFWRLHSGVFCSVEILEAKGKSWAHCQKRFEPQFYVTVYRIVRSSYQTDLAWNYRAKYWSVQSFYFWKTERFFLELKKLHFLLKK